MIQFLLDDDGKQLITKDPLDGSAGIANFGGFALNRPSKSRGWEFRVNPETAKDQPWWHFCQRVDSYFDGKEWPRNRDEQSRAKHLSLSTVVEADQFDPLATIICEQQRVASPKSAHYISIQTVFLRPGIGVDQIKIS